MGLYYLELDKLAEFEQTTVEELKKLSYECLEEKISSMRKAKIIERQKESEEDVLYRHLVTSYFYPFGFLRHWFTEDEIVLACAAEDVTEHSLCREQAMPVRDSKTLTHTKGEYLRTSFESVYEYNRHGRRYADPVRKKMDVYRVASEYQGSCHGAVILRLLYEKYPKLSTYGFSAYSMGYGESDYEMYPRNNIYTSFTSLMAGNVDAIIHRNHSYCINYNHSIYTPKAFAERIKSEEVISMFDSIREIGEENQKAGYSVFYDNEKGERMCANGLVRKFGSTEEGVEIFKNRESGRVYDEALWFNSTKPFTVRGFAKKFLELYGADAVNVHVCHISDYTKEKGVRLCARRTPGSFNIGPATGHPMPPIPFDVSACPVTSAFGSWQYPHIDLSDNPCGGMDLILRIDCPEIG